MHPTSTSSRLACPPHGTKNIRLSAQVKVTDETASVSSKALQSITHDVLQHLLTQFSSARPLPQPLIVRNLGPR